MSLIFAELDRFRLVIDKFDQKIMSEHDLAHKISNVSMNMSSVEIISIDHSMPKNDRLDDVIDMICKIVKICLKFMKQLIYHVWLIIYELILIIYDGLAIAIPKIINFAIFCFELAKLLLFVIYRLCTFIIRMVFAICLFVKDVIFYVVRVIWHMIIYSIYGTHSSSVTDLQSDINIFMRYVNAKYNAVLVDYDLSKNMDCSSEKHDHCIAKIDLSIVLNNTKN